MTNQSTWCFLHHPTIIATAIATQATAIPPFSPAERPDEDDGVGEGEESEPVPVPKLELEPGEAEGPAWPDVVEEAIVAVLVSLMKKFDRRSGLGSQIATYLPCRLLVSCHPRTFAEPAQSQMTGHMPMSNT